MGKRVFTTIIGERKTAAARIAEITGQKVVYTRAPRFAYQVGGIFIESDGTVTAMKRADLNPLRTLAAEGLCEALEEQAQENGEDTNKAHTDGLVISLPKGMFTDSSLANLEKILDAKAGLIKKAMNADRLDIKTTDDRVSFPWWDQMPERDEVQTYMSFIAALCKMAKEAKRVTAKESEVESEKYTFRCFLLRLGYVGPDRKEERKILLSRLSGSAAFANQGKADAFAAAQKAKRDAAEK